MRFVKIDAAGICRHEESSPRNPFSLSPSEDHRENRSPSAGDKVNVLSRAARHGADMCFQELKTRKPCLDNVQQSSVLSPELCPELISWIGHLGIIMGFDRAFE